MNTNFIILFLSAFLAGLVVIFYPEISKRNFKTILTFSGAYLFSITVIHILPELFHEATNPGMMGIYVLVGFFLQMILELFSSGVEHGHLHGPKDEHGGMHSSLIFSMMASLCFHAFLEGSLLVNGHHHHATGEVHAHTDALLYGLVMHKIPESIALASILLYAFKNKATIIGCLILFALASPMGLLTSNILSANDWFSSESFSALFAVVAGNFLYISTTIFFESSPNHQFKFRKLLVSFVGASLAIVAEKLVG